MTARGGRLGRVSFDEQAGVFESRAGMPEDVAAQVAEAVLDYASVGPDDLVVEIGAGTGLIGQWLARPPVRYLGMDNSQAMLDVFGSRLPPGGHASLRYADANQPWPVPDGAARAVFGSRVFQLLDVEHLVGEATRVAHPHGAVLLHGKVSRGPDSPAAMVRTRTHELLSARGYTPRPTGRLLRQLWSRAEAAGGTRLPPRTVATWQREIRPSDVLDARRQKHSMGGITPPAEITAAILDELAAWAAATFTDPRTPVPTEESYVLEGVRLRSESDPQRSAKE